MNVFGTKSVLLIAVLGFITGRPDFLDIALIHAPINFISLIAVLRFFEFGRFRSIPLPHNSTQQDGSPCE